MIKVENIEVWGFEHAVRGMRNPMNSWDKSDSIMCYGEKFSDCKSDCEKCPRKNEEDFENDIFCIGKNDLDLMRRLYKVGSEHRKYLRQIFVSMDITAPLYWWKEFDTYKVGTVANSCSTMHKIHAKEFTLDDFSHEHLISEYNLPDYKDVYYEENMSEKKIIDGYEDYLISDDGIVYSTKTGEERVLVQRVDIDGYKTVGLYKNGKCKRFKVHRLVANAFIAKDGDRDCVNHIDGNKWNNTKEN